MTRASTTSRVMLIHEHSTRVTGPDGTTYRARVFARERSDHTWAGWIEFDPLRGGGAVLSTDRETSQPDRAAVEYWAAGLEPIYLDGALERARRRLTTSQPPAGVSEGPGPTG